MKWKAKIIIKILIRDTMMFETITRLTRYGKRRFEDGRMGMLYYSVLLCATFLNRCDHTYPSHSSIVLPRKKTLSAQQHTKPQKPQTYSSGRRTCSIQIIWNVSHNTFYLTILFVTHFTRFYTDTIWLYHDPHTWNVRIVLIIVASVLLMHDDVMYCFLHTILRHNIHTHRDVTSSSHSAHSLPHCKKRSIDVCARRRL